MATVVVSATVKVFAAPAGTVAGQYEVSITDASGVRTAQDVGSPSATFLNVVPGAYTAAVQLLDSNGGPLGDAQSAAFSVSAPATVDVSVPDVVSVQVS